MPSGPAEASFLLYCRWLWLQKVIEWTRIHQLPKSNFLYIHIMELKQTDYSWLRSHAELLSSSLSKVGLLQFGWLGGQNYQHGVSLGPRASIHLISTLFPPRLVKNWLIAGKFRGFAAKTVVLWESQCFVGVTTAKSGILGGLEISKLRGASQNPHTEA